MTKPYSLVAARVIVGNSGEPLAYIERVIPGRGAETLLKPIEADRLARQIVAALNAETEIRRLFATWDGWRAFADGFDPFALLDAIANVVGEPQDGHSLAPGVIAPGVWTVPDDQVAPVNLDGARDYRVRWESDQIATSPLQAIALARDAFAAIDPTDDRTATVFEVAPFARNGAVTAFQTVDLAETAEIDDCPQALALIDPNGVWAVMGPQNDTDTLPLMARFKTQRNAELFLGLSKRIEASHLIAGDFTIDGPCDPADLDQVERDQAEREQAANAPEFGDPLRAIQRAEQTIDIDAEGAMEADGEAFEALHDPRFDDEDDEDGDRDACTDQTPNPSDADLAAIAALNPTPAPHPAAPAVKPSVLIVVRPHRHNGDYVVEDTSPDGVEVRDVAYFASKEQALGAGADRLLRHQRAAFPYKHTVQLQVRD